MSQSLEEFFPEKVNGYGVDVAMDNLWMEIGKPYFTEFGTFYDAREFIFENPMETKKWDNQDKIAENIVETCCTVEYIHFFAKYILNIDLLPYQCAIIQMLWDKPLPILIATRGGGKSFILAVYLIMRACLNQGCRICVVGAALRQSMVLFNYLQNIWDSAPILRDICGGKHNEPKRDQHACHWNCGKSVVSFLPLGTGEKIRGQRANIIIADEFQSLPAPIFETVVRGFASVKSQGVHHNVMTAYKKNILKHYGLDEAKDFQNLTEKHNKNLRRKQSKEMSSNQIIISGTASYQFNHFYRYYSFYKAIILTGGSKKELKRQFPDMEIIGDSIDPTDYAIMRIPYDAIPPGLMDDKILSQGRATMDPNIFSQEYCCIFSGDSNGFFLASTLNACTCPIYASEVDDKGFVFAPKINGSQDHAYVMSIDPASEDDNFAIMIMELQEDGSRHVVYVWTTNREDFESLKKSGGINKDIHDYNTFCIRHIRDLKRRFNIVKIICDSGGGGISLKEGLRDPSKLLDQMDDLIYDAEDPHVAREKGLHILHLMEFSNKEWYRESHYALRSDLLNRKILFPYYDMADMAIDAFYHEDFLGKDIFDKKENVYLEIEQCKQETVLIKHNMTPGGSERWDVPKIVGLDADMLKKQLKKDRFSALLLANWGCRMIQGDATKSKISDFLGGTAREIAAHNRANQSSFLAPSIQLINNPGQNRKVFY